jgi:EmrB/QacA subfamily drug resistance transporter
MVSKMASDRATIPEDLAPNKLATSVFGLAIVVLGAVQLMLVLDGSIVNIALPHLQRDPAIQLSDKNLSWVVNGYALAFGGLLLLGGRSGDTLGRRRMFIVGIAVFTGASLLGACAWNEFSLIAARVLQGGGAAIASPTALALVSTTFAPGPVRNRAFGIYAAMTGVGSAVGLLLGGLLTDVSWRWTFFINVPIGLVVLVLAPRGLPTTAPVKASFDFRGAATATAGFSALVYGLTAGREGWPWILAGALLVITFVVLESKTDHPLVPLRLFADKDRAFTYLATFITGASLFAMAYFLSRYVQEVLHYSALQAGVAFLPFAVASGLASQLTSTLSSRVNPRWIIGPGSLVMAGGFLWAARMEVDASYVRDLLGPMILIAAGFSFMLIPLTMSAVTRVESQDAGAASAVLSVMQQLGGAMGLAALAAISTAVTKASGGHAGGAGARSAADIQALADGFGAAFDTCAIFVIVAGLISVFGLRTTHEELS